jgi:hypothetical protein
MCAICSQAELKLPSLRAPESIAIALNCRLDYLVGGRAPAGYPPAPILEINAVSGRIDAQSLREWPSETLSR